MKRYNQPTYERFVSTKWSKFLREIMASSLNWKILKYKPKYIIYTTYVCVYICL